MKIFFVFTLFNIGILNLFSQEKSSISISFGDTSSTNNVLPIELFSEEFEPIFKKDKKFIYDIYSINSLIDKKVKRFTIVYSVTNIKSGKVSVDFLIKEENEKVIKEGETFFIENNQAIKISIPSLEDFNWLDATVEPTYNFLIELLNSSGNNQLQLENDIKYKHIINKRVEGVYLDSIDVIQYPKTEKVKCKLSSSDNFLNCSKGEINYSSDLGDIRCEYIVEAGKYGFVQLHYYFENRKKELIISLRDVVN